MLHIVKDYRKRTANLMVIECDGCGAVADWTPSPQWMLVDRIDCQHRDYCDDCAVNVNHRSPNPNRFDCVDCGPGIGIDEDGCCSTCGKDAIVVLNGRPRLGRW